MHENISKFFERKNVYVLVYHIFYIPNPFIYALKAKYFEKQVQKYII